jgi:hypothetical protein
LAGLGLDDDDPHAVGHQVVQLAGDPGTLLGHRPGGLRSTVLLGAGRALGQVGGLPPP